MTLKIIILGHTGRGGLGMLWKKGLRISSLRMLYTQSSNLLHENKKMEYLYRFVWVSSLRDAFLEWKVVYFMVMIECHRRYNMDTVTIQGVSIDTCHSVKPVLWVRFSINKGLGGKGRVPCADQGQFSWFCAPWVLLCRSVGRGCPLEVGPQVKSAHGGFPSLPVEWILCLWRKTFLSCTTVNTCNSVNQWSSHVYSWLLLLIFSICFIFFFFKLRLGMYFQWLQAKQTYLNTEIRQLMRQGLKTSSTRKDGV